MSAGPLRLGGVPEHFNLPWRLALESGALADLDLVWTDQPGGTGQMLDALAEGTLDVVSILTEGTVGAIAGGLAATIVQVYVASPLQWGVHVPASSAFATVDDLDPAVVGAGGPRYAISRRRSGSHLMALIQTHRQGWPIEESQLVEVRDLAGARAAFAAGDADVFLWDRFMTQPLVDAGEFRRVGVEPTPWPSFVIAARDEALLGRTLAVGCVIDAVVAEATALHDRPGIVDELVERYGIPATAARSWLEVTEFAPRAAFDPAVAADTLALLHAAGWTD